MITNKFAKSIDVLPIESIQERDVDLLLLEELYCNESFCEWFVQELGLPLLKEKIGIWRSISDFGLGETDLLFSYKSDKYKIFVLIENKLNSPFQEEQYNRYLKRAENYINSKACDIAYSILVAPDFYCENQHFFEHYISYESIAMQFEITGTNRSLFKKELLRIGSEKLRRGYQAINSESVQGFWLSYFEYKEKYHPSLKMKKPGIVPHESDWPMLFDERMKGIIFYHKLAQGNVDATFRENSKEKELYLKNQLFPDWKIVKHNKSFSVRIFTGTIDRTKDFDKQIDLVENGLTNLEKLRDWILTLEL